MRVWLEFPEGQDVAVLNILEGTRRTEVRGNRMVGVRYEGDRLDRVLRALPRTVNISALMAEQVIGLRPVEEEAMRAALAREEELRALMLGAIRRSIK